MEKEVEECAQRYVPLAAQSGSVFCRRLSAASDSVTDLLVIGISRQRWDFGGKHPAGRTGGPASLSSGSTLCGNWKTGVLVPARLRLAGHRVLDLSSFYYCFFKYILFI